MDAVQIVAELALTARKAGRTLSTATGAERKAALYAIAEAIEKRSAEILTANAIDIESAKSEDMHPQMQDRLLLNASRVLGIANGARLVADLPDPLGQVLRHSTLPNGLETMVGERGHRLSGGEKQRLAIARLLLKSPSIVILDEATAHLDSENEELVQSALASALQGRTSIVIAHRLSTVMSADQIIVLENGLIRERGKHDDLVRAGGLYSELFARQDLTTSN
jgi:ABC-type transport system involved in cytochrome bd biosynthesis fused ATPase/permease subunit